MSLPTEMQNKPQLKECVSIEHGYISCFFFVTQNQLKQLFSTLLEEVMVKGFFIYHQKYIGW